MATRPLCSCTGARFDCTLIGAAARPCTRACRAHPCAAGPRNLCRQLRPSPTLWHSEAFSSGGRSGDLWEYPLGDRRGAERGDGAPPAWHAASIMRPAPTLPNYSFAHAHARGALASSEYGCRTLTPYHSVVAKRRFRRWGQQILYCRSIDGGFWRRWLRGIAHGRAPNYPIEFILQTTLTQWEDPIQNTP